MKDFATRNSIVFRHNRSYNSRLRWGGFNTAAVPPTVINPTSGDTKKYCGLDFRVYLDLKNAIHRYLLNKVDLERVAATPDDQTREQVLAVVQDVDRKSRRLSVVPKKSVYRSRSWMKSSAWGRLRHCCKTRRSATFW